MEHMKKEIIYLMEYLSKSDKDDEAKLYQAIIHALERTVLYTPSRYTQEKLCILMRHATFETPENFQEALKLLDARFEELIPSSLMQMRKTIFKTLLISNFPKKKSFLEHSLALFESQLEPVEKNIYQSIMAYVMGLNRALCFFFLLGEKSTPEMLLTFSSTLHVTLMESIFNEEEKVLLEKGLKELMGVYVGIYGKYLYEKQPV